MAQIKTKGGIAMLRAAYFCATSAAILISTSGVQAQQPEAPPPPSETITSFTPVTDAMLANPKPDDWLMWRRTLDNWGYSPLEQITRRNVAQLRLAWTRPLAHAGDQEGTPLVHDGIMY